MLHQKPASNFFLAAACLTVVVSACVPAAPQVSQTVSEIIVTSTPEIFNPLNPSPTPSSNALPMTCQVTDLSVYVNREWGYCFAYPQQYTLDESRAADGIVSLSGPTLEDGPDPIHVSLELTTQPVPRQSSLNSLEETYLATFGGATVSMGTRREPWLLGSEPAVKMEPIPGLLSSQVIMALHNNILLTLRFHPSDIDFAREDLDALTQTVTGSFAFLDEIDPPASLLQKASWYEFGKEISLSYDSIIAPWVEVKTVDAVPPDDQMMYVATHPGYAQFHFLGYLGQPDRPLTSLLEKRIPQVMVFRTADFPGYGDDSPQGFVGQYNALADVLEAGLDPALCGKQTSGTPALPFLPWINAAQVFCSQPKVIEFPGGRGIRYLTYYSQGMSPIVDQQVFYTFQGLTNDGQFYISAAFPLQTGIFPTVPPACPKCSDPNFNPLPEWQATFTEQLGQLNVQPEDEFTPSLKALDDLIESVRIGQ
jgi:hypothetical protein